MNIIEKIHYIMIGLSAIGIVFVTMGFALKSAEFWEIVDIYFYVIFFSIIITSSITIKMYVSSLNKEK